VPTEVDRSSHAPVVRIEVVWPTGHPVRPASCRPTGEQGRSNTVTHGQVRFATELQREGSRQRGHNEGTSLREDAGHDEKC
jgi:hypothetical protein